MFNVMIVEDEYIVREDLKSLINWEEYGFHIVKEARNGIEGIAFYDQYYPRVIITDIKMPVMGGFEMIEQLVKKDRGLKFIILSSYGEFDFARKAIKLGIGTYLLKHEIDSDVLIKELIRLRMELKEEDRIKEINLSNSFKGIIEGDLQPNEFETIALQNNLHYLSGNMLMIILDLDSHGNELYDLNYNVELPTEAQILNILHCLNCRNYTGYLVSMSENRYIIFISFSEKKETDILHESINHICSSLQKEFNNSIKNNMHLAVSKPIYNLNDIKNCYSETSNLMALKIFKKSSEILFYDRWRPISLDKYNNYYEEYINSVDKFEESVKNGQVEHAKEMVAKIYTDILVRLENVKMLRKCNLNMLSIILRQFPEVADSNNKKFQEMLSEVSQLENVYYICEWFLYIIDMLNRGNDAYTKKVKNAIDYIKANYSKDISLKGLGDSIGVSTTYASQLFKKEVGESFITYLTKYRISKAKEFLESGKYKIYEVSDMVGYQSVQYFCKIFKKNTGKNPGYYYKL